MTQQGMNQQQDIQMSNLMFLQQSIERSVYCPVTGGNGVTANWTAGQTLNFDFPPISGGYIHALEITYNLAVTPTAGGTNAYALNAAAPYSIFTAVDIQYGNRQVHSHPYFFSKILPVLKGFQRGPQARVLAGNNDGLIASQLCGATPVVAGQANTWQGKFLLDLTPLGIDTVPGILPAMSVGNKPQIQLTCNPSFFGLDSFNNVVAATGNSTPGGTVTGTVNIDAYYRDGSSMRTNVPFGLKLHGEPTGQYYWDSQLTPFNQGTTWQRKQISVLLEHVYMASIIIDGQQSNQFMSNYANLNAFELTPDLSGQNVFVGWNSGNNVSIYDYFKRQVRELHGQDLDCGVILWVDAPSRGVSNPENKHGMQTLNMTSNGGFVATSHAYQVNAVSATNFTPRVETFFWSINADGLKLVS